MNWVQNMNRCVGPTEPPRNGTEKGTEMVDIVERLHYAGYNDARLGEAAAEIERLRSAVNEHRNAAMEADLRTQAAVRGEKKALAERVNLSELRRVMTEWHQRAVALGFDGVPDLVASIEAGRPTNTPLRELIETHGEFLEANPYCYFELAYTRRTEWMAWICSKPSADDPNRKVIAQGQGSTPDEAAEDALAHMTPNV